jgi:hypothetical protein
MTFWLVTFTKQVEADDWEEAIQRADDGKGGGHWEATPADQQQRSKLDIVVYRDPDGPNSIDIYLDGKPIESSSVAPGSEPGDAPVDINVVDVDPGRGWLLDEWNENRDYEAAIVHSSLAGMVRELYDSTAERYPSYVEMQP